MSYDIVIYINIHVYHVYNVIYIYTHYVRTYFDPSIHPCIDRYNILECIVLQFQMSGFTHSPFFEDLQAAELQALEVKQESILAEGSSEVATEKSSTTISMCIEMGKRENHRVFLQFETRKTQKNGIQSISITIEMV